LNKKLDHLKNLKKFYQIDQGNKITNWKQRAIDWTGSVYVRSMSKPISW
jgi:hypothetical protein